MARKVRVADKPGVAEVQAFFGAINSRGDQCWYWKATVPATPVQLIYTEITSRRPTTNTLFNLDTIRQPQGGAFFDQNAVAIGPRRANRKTINWRVRRDISDAG